VLRRLEKAARIAKERVVADRAQGIADERVDLRFFGNALLDVHEAIELRLQIAGWCGRIGRIAERRGVDPERRCDSRRIRERRRIGGRRCLVLVVATGEEKSDRKGETAHAPPFYSGSLDD